MVKKKTEKPNSSVKNGLPGLGPITGKKLENAGVKSGFDILIMGSQEISQVTGLKREETDKMVEKTITQLTEEGKLNPMSTREEINEYRKKQYHLESGCKSLDEMLRGGVESQSLTEVYGPEGAGKTQFINSIVVSTLAKKQAVFYMDCEGTEDDDRLLEIAKARGVEIDLNNLYVTTAYDSYLIEKAIKTLPQIILENNIKLVVCDGIMGKYRLEYDQGRGELNTRQNDVKMPFRHLQNMALYLNIPVICTNQVMGNPDGGWGADPIKPIGGHVVGHNFKYIIKFNKGGKNKRSASVVKSNKDPQYHAEFYLTEEGVTDPENITADGTLKKKREELLTTPQPYEEQSLKDTNLLLES